MIELPEALTLAAQCREHLVGRRVLRAEAAHSPHRFTFYCGAPEDYAALLQGRAIENAEAFGGHVLLTLDGARVVLCDGPNPRLLAPGEKRPEKRQLLLELDDGRALCCTVQMYAGIYAFAPGDFDTEYFRVAREKPSPLSDAFDRAHFDGLFAQADEKTSVKALLATEQRVPGLGNGVLQDILFFAQVHPKSRAKALDGATRERLFDSVKKTLGDMAAQGGRDVERDLFGQPGGYRTRASRLTLGAPCPVCSEPIIKEAYLGGVVYVCPHCQAVVR